MKVVLHLLDNRCSSGRDAVYTLPQGELKQLEVKFSEFNNGIFLSVALPNTLGTPTHARLLLLCQVDIFFSAYIAYCKTIGFYMAADGSIQTW